MNIITQLDPYINNVSIILHLIYEVPDQVQFIPPPVEVGISCLWFVKRDAQSKGIGTELLHFLKKQKETLQLSVYAKNTKAVAFYKHNGFTITSTGLDEDTNEQDYLMTWQRQ